MIPDQDNGEPWPQAMICASEDGQNLDLVLAQTASELLGELIEDYPHQDEEDSDREALVARTLYGTRLAQGIQESLLSMAQDDGVFDVATAGDETIAHLLSDKARGRDLDGPWEDVVPLVCVDMCYEPFTDTPRPDGNILWVGVASETDLLGVLDEMGAIEWMPDFDPASQANTDTEENNVEARNGDADD